METPGNALLAEPWQASWDKLSKLTFNASYLVAESVLIEVNVCLNTEEKISLCILNLHRLKRIFSTGSGLFDKIELDFAGTRQKPAFS